MLITKAYAQGFNLGGFDLGGALGNASQFMPLVLIFVVFYFLLIRPQQQKQKELRRMLGELKRGDKVVTGGGILGTVQKVTVTTDRNGKSVVGSEIEVEIAPNIRVTVLRETITSVVKPVVANDIKPPAKVKAS